MSFDGGVYNTEICNFDGGDCLEFNSKYPDCKNAYPESVGNGYSDIEADTALNSMKNGLIVNFIL